MALFSQRMGITPMKKAFQREALDEETRNRLWNALFEELFQYKNERVKIRGNFQDSRRAKEVERICTRMYDEYWKRIHAGKKSYNSADASLELIKGFILKGYWWQSLDVIEYILKSIEYEYIELNTLVNKVFEQENCAYRVIDNQIVEVTDEQEIAAIETAITDGAGPVVTHLRQALVLLSDRKQPDFRNSMKESISAVEAHCRLLLGNDKLTLGQALKQIKQRVNLHPALEESVSKLYGFTSDSGGIRHSLTAGTEEPDYAEAKFMLVACTNFINFLRLKSADNKLTHG